MSDCGSGYKIKHSKRSRFFQIMDSEFVKQLLLNVKQEIALEGASSKNALQQLTKVLNYISASTFQQKDPPAQDLFPQMNLVFCTLTGMIMNANKCIVAYFNTERNMGLHQQYLKRRHGRINAFVGRKNIYLS